MNNLLSSRLFNIIMHSKRFRANVTKRYFQYISFSFFLLFIHEKRRLCFTSIKGILFAIV